MKTSRKDQLNEMPSSFVMCRVIVGTHVPAHGYPVISRTPGGGYEQMFVCENCGAEVRNYRDRHGFRTGGRKYKYEPGYLIQEGGALTASEKADLFVGEASSANVTKFGRVS